MDCRSPRWRWPNGLNANLLRRWVVAHEGTNQAVISSSAPPSPTEPSPGFMPLTLAVAPVVTANIRIELHGHMTG